MSNYYKTNSLKQKNPNCKLCNINGEYSCSKGAKNNHLECLKYAHENNCPWDEKIINKIKLYNETEYKYITCTSTACIVASSHGHLECLKYAHENGCPWNYITTLVAAKNGHLECLKYARDNGCPLKIHAKSKAVGKVIY